MIDFSIADLLGGEPVETDQDLADQVFQQRWPGISNREIAEKLRQHAKKSARSGAASSDRIASDLRAFADQYDARAKLSEANEAEGDGAPSDPR